MKKQKLIIKKENIKQILKIVGGFIFLVIFILTGFYINKKISHNEIIYSALSLEEIAEKENKDMSEFIPEPSNIKSLEEIAQESSATLEDLMPTPSNVPPLEETTKK